MDLYEIIWETEDALAKALGIPGDVMDYTVREFIGEYEHNFKYQKLYDENNNLISTIDELVDFILRQMEGNENA